MLVLNKNWNSLIKPSNISLKEKDVDGHLATFVVEPFERGFGLTFGNALRRILLSSIRGAAITAIRSPGILHEFSSKSGIKEDIVDIILNIKKIQIKMENDGAQSVRLKAKGPCVVTAGMIESTNEVSVLTPEQVICTLSDSAELDMEFICETGKGYVPAQTKKEYDNAIDIIPIDALYNPVKRVAYKVEDTRVGQVTDYDKLVIEIETNGSVKPEMAIGLAARIMQDQLQTFITFEEQEEVKEDMQDELEFDPILLKKVSHLELSVRSQNCLQNDNIVYIGDLVIKTESEMLKTQNFGRKSLNEIKDILGKFSLKFGMDIPGWPPENVEDLAKKYEEPY